PRGDATLIALAKGETAIDTFTYTITDQHGATSIAKMTLTVVGVNDPPVAVADAASTDQNTPVAIPVLANDTDPDHGAVLSVAAVAAKSANGATLTLNPDGTVTYD